MVQAQDRVALGAALRSLAPNERRVVHLRFIEDLSQAQIARRIGRSQVHVSRTLRSALLRLHEQLAARVRTLPLPSRRGARSVTPMATASAATCQDIQTRTDSHSGRLLLRMPPALHSDLAQARRARRLEPQRLHHGHPGERRRPRRSRGRSGGRLLRYAVIADLVLVAIAAVVAVALLIAAWP